MSNLFNKVNTIKVLADNEMELDVNNFIAGAIYLMSRDAINAMNLVCQEQNLLEIVVSKAYKFFNENRNKFQWITHNLPKLKFIFHKWYYEERCPY